VSDSGDAGGRWVHRRGLLAGAGAAVAGLAGCLGNPWEPGAAESAQERTGASHGTNATDGGGEADVPSEPAVVVDVAEEDFRFTPEHFEIDVGQTVKWVWRSGGHNVRVDSKPDGSDWSGTAGGATDTYPEGHELVATFETPGEYDYYCAPHRSLGLEGSFTVREE